MTPILLLACTRPNPAFEDDGEDAGAPFEGDTEGEGGSDTADGTESGESLGDEGDLPEAVCEYQPSAGLELLVGVPDDFGGQCPTSIDIWARIPESGGGLSAVETCMPGCGQCTGDLSLSIHPLFLADYLPTDTDNCVRIQATGPLGGNPGPCEWGAISLHDGWNGTPYFVAITHNVEPTPMGLATVGGLIPEPVKVANCDCDEVGQSHECCYQAESPPEFLAYPWGDDLLMPGDSVQVMLDDGGDADHYFEVFQAERLNACESSERSLSWALWAELP